MTAAQPDALYYLRNFVTALQWLKERYDDLLSIEESEFIVTFEGLPEHCQALLVRLIMRKHDCFRASKIAYAEIGDIPTAVSPLIEAGFIDNAPLLTLAELFRLLRREELNELFDPDATVRAAGKRAFLELLESRHLYPRTFESWRGAMDECAYRVCVAVLCTRLRLLFFGSFHQDWSAFVLADLGIFKYEQVELSRESRVFECREDIEAYYRIHSCREHLYNDAPLREIVAKIPRESTTNDWLERHRAKVVFEVAQRYEREGDTEAALTLYRQCAYPGAQVRAIRVLECAGRYAHALDSAIAAYRTSTSAAEAQRLERIIPRLHRRVGVQTPQRFKKLPIPRIEMVIEPHGDASVEECVRMQLESSRAPVFYVENSLVNALFGLLFWDAIFAPVRGAFFHRFHSAPMDLHSLDFVQRRCTLVDRCFERLESGTYPTIIRATFREKQGIASPFVAWGCITEPLLDLALKCVPPMHLKRFFERILADTRENCTGLPDLIQFWPDESNYRLVEVKGPGDRLQDNQTRWMQYCVTHGVPIEVAYARWAEVRT